MTHTEIADNEAAAAAALVAIARKLTSNQQGQKAVLAVLDDADYQAITAASRRIGRPLI